LARISNYITSPHVAAERYREALAEVEGIAPCERKSKKGWLGHLCSYAKM
jgi:hypothetical protein